MDKFFLALACLTGLTMIVSLFLVNRQFFKIMARIEGRPYKGFYYEYFFNLSKYTFTSAFVDYFPLSLINKFLDNKTYSEKSDDIKELYSTKFRFEKIFYLSLVLFIAFCVFSDGTKISW